MKKLMAAALLAALAGTVQADDLADGIKAWESQDFTKAHKLLGKLAEAGNPEAQLMVGEMYGYGEGVPENMATAEMWIKKAQAGGHKDAAESLSTMQQRGAHKQDIAYYISGYKGDDLKLEKYGCVKPDIPAGDKMQTQKDIKAVRDAYQEWDTCYRRFADGLTAAQPAGKAIPANIAKLMSLAELQQARTAMGQTYDQIAMKSERDARGVVDSYNAWVARTKDYSLAMQKKIGDETEQARRENETLMQRYREATGSATTPPRR